MNAPLKIKAACRGNPQCWFEGEDIFLDISVINIVTAPVGFPLQFVQKTGPSIKLTDATTKKECHLRHNLADLALQSVFSPIPAGDSATLTWVIKSSELERLNPLRVDLFAEITVATQIQTAGQLNDFQGADTLHIVSRNPLTPVA